MATQKHSKYQNYIQHFKYKILHDQITMHIESILLLYLYDRQNDQFVLDFAY